jgi:ribonucleoside-diphosphate reductase alpha chain
MNRERERLPSERESRTHQFTIGDCKGYITAGLYEDGRVGEIFVKVDKQGSTVSGFADAWAISVSWLLQLGVPLEDVCKKYKASRFEPSGVTNNKNIRFATSIIDYMVRWLEGRFVDTQMFSEEQHP